MLGSELSFESKSKKYSTTSMDCSHGRPLANKNGCVLNICASVGVLAKSWASRVRFDQDLHSTFQKNYARGTMSEH